MNPGAPFVERLREATARAGSPLCVGLDPDPAPGAAAQPSAAEARRICMELIDCTAPFAAAFKPNSAFFERLGRAGWELLAEVVGEARRRALVIVDGKRGDIGNTAKAYAESVFDALGADACTVTPYMGRDAVEPFMQRPGRLAFVVCRSSNPGAADLQDLTVGPEQEPLYATVARQAVAWDRAAGGGRLGLVAGATWPEQVDQLRDLAPEMPFLVPGVGTQGGSLATAAVAAAGAEGTAPFLINVSRSLAAAHAKGGSPGAAAAAAALREQLRAAGRVAQGKAIVAAPADL